MFFVGLLFPYVSAFCAAREQTSCRSTICDDRGEGVYLTGPQYTCSQAKENIVANKFLSLSHSQSGQLATVHSDGEQTTAQRMLEVVTIWPN